MGSNTEKSSQSGQALASLYLLGSSCPPLRTGDMHTRVSVAGAARGSSSEAGMQHPHAEPLQLSFLEMTQRHPCLFQRTDWPLKSDRGLRNCCSIFTHLFLHTSNKERQLTFRTTLGSTEVVISTKTLPWGRGWMLPSAPVQPGVTEEQSLGDTSPGRLSSGPRGVLKTPQLVNSVLKLRNFLLNRT